MIRDLRCGHDAVVAEPFSHSTLRASTVRRRRGVEETIPQGDDSSKCNKPRLAGAQNRRHEQTPNQEIVSKIENDIGMVTHHIIRSKRKARVPKQKLPHRAERLID